jgi:hypothetical protein
MIPNVNAAAACARDANPVLARPFIRNLLRAFSGQRTGMESTPDPEYAKDSTLTTNMEK